MKKFLSGIIRFAGFFALITLTFIIIDTNTWDYRGNVYFNHVLEDDSTTNHIIIGSSKVYWSFIDTLLPDVTLIGDGGQYNYACLTMFNELEERGLLKNKTVWLALEDDSEIKAGFGNWWYFSEAFFKYRFASFFDYPMSDWPQLAARIYVDIFTLKPNESKVFRWTGIDELYEREVNDTRLINHFHNFNNNLNSVPLSKAFENSVSRFISELDEIEERNNCEVKFLILQFPNWRGNLSDYVELFGANRTVNMLPDSVNPSDFNDQNHLNSTGALKATLLFNEIKNLEH
jgi:hypothetical protein